MKPPKAKKLKSTRLESPTIRLAFIDNKLMQLWHIDEMDDSGDLYSTASEWREVPYLSSHDLLHNDNY